MKVTTRTRQLAADLVRQVCCHPQRRQPGHHCAASTRLTVDIIEVHCPRCGTAREEQEQPSEEGRHVR